MPGRITFRNGKGDRLHIHKDRKLTDLIEMGVTEIKFEGKWSFLPNGWYSVEKNNNNQKEREANMRKIAIGIAIVVMALAAVIGQQPASQGRDQWWLEGPTIPKGWQPIGAYQSGAGMVAVVVSNGGKETAVVIGQLH